jgi:hypothetical protein
MGSGYRLMSATSKKQAQIVIKANLEINTIEKAEEMIEELGARIIQSRTLSPQLFLLKSNTKHIWEIVLKLSQKGFGKIEGYNAPS